MAAPRIVRPEADEHIAYYGRYITMVPGDDAWPALEFQLDETLRLLRPLDEKASLHRYEPGKWSVKEVLGHVTDVERVFGYRALRFARADATPLPGFDENAWVPVGAFDQRPLTELVDELRATRAATLAMLRGFDADAFGRAGSANDARITVRALAWIIAGHERHHRQLLRERYGLA
jgi:hypothetical protein